jgi:hypothetical protein
MWKDKELWVLVEEREEDHCDWHTKYMFFICFGKMWIQRKTMVAYKSE